MKDLAESSSLKNKMAGFSTAHVLEPGDSKSVKYECENMLTFYEFI
jgi:hypothetical protein